MDVSNARSAGGATALKREYVSCQNIFQRESDRIFARSWICACRSSDLDIDSGVIPLEIEGHRLMLVRTSEGKINAFRNFCRHRGSQLVTRENCAAIRQRIQCPYHAWTYDRDGQLVSAPNMQDLDQFELDDFGLLRVACESYGGFIWINLQPTSSIDNFLLPIESQFSDWSLPTLICVAELNYDVRANWKLIFQNYNECYHCPIVHPLLNRLTPFNEASNSLDSGPILGGPMKLADDCQTMSTDGQAIAGLLPRLDQQQKRSVNYFTIFPTMFLSTHPDYVLVHYVQRTGVDSTRVTCQFLVEPDSAQQAGFDPRRAVEFWDMTNRQDWDVCELAQRGMQDPGYTPGPYSNLESLLAAFDQHYLNQLEG